VIAQQERAWVLVQQIAGTATRLVIALVVILSGTFSLLVEGDGWYRWVEEHSPITPALLHRLRDAFYETGRGLFVGIGGAGLLQAIVATIAYLALRVPHAFELGLLTFCFSVIPAVGTALVWGPVAAGLALTDRTGAAIILVIAGVAVIGTVDNLVRPFLARRGRLQLPTYVVLVSMFAGVEVLGPWGLLVAPLAVRLAKAVLETEPPTAVTMDGGA
jgi:predicted PurR-regulated permease PerM